MGCTICVQVNHAHPAKASARKRSSATPPSFQLFFHSCLCVHPPAKDNDAYDLWNCRLSPANPIQVSIVTKHTVANRYFSGWSSHFTKDSKSSLSEKDPVASPSFFMNQSACSSPSTSVLHERVAFDAIGSVARLARV